MKLSEKLIIEFQKNGINVDNYNGMTSLKVIIEETCEDIEAPTNWIPANHIDHLGRKARFKDLFEDEWQEGILLGYQIAANRAIRFIDKESTQSAFFCEVEDVI